MLIGILASPLLIVALLRALDWPSSRQGVLAASIFVGIGSATALLVLGDGADLIMSGLSVLVAPVFFVWGSLSSALVLSVARGL